MLRVFESFAGIGTQRMGLERANIDHEVVGICEIDKFAIDSYKAIHGEVKNFGDICKIDPKDLPDFDLFTYSFPCQDISMAGKQKGFEKDSGTRSSLLWECERIIEAKRPKYLLMENVKALTFKKNKAGYEKWLDILTNLGYTNYSKVLNAKDYGVPQNRERVFCISILNDSQGYSFPEKQVLKTRLKDILEENVDEKYYLSSERVKKLVGIVRNYDIKDRSVFDSSINDPKEKEVANCVTTKQRGISIRKSEGNVVVEPELMQTHKLNSKNRNNPERFRVFDKEGISPTLNTCQGGGLQPCIDEINEAKIVQTHKIKHQRRTNTSEFRTYNADGLSPTLLSNSSKPCVTVELPAIAASRGRLRDDKFVQQLELKKDGTSNTLTTVGKDNYLVTKENPQNDIRIRKLTPLEFWRLMGIEDKDFYKARKVNSDSQLYKQAGNAIVVDVLAAIFMQLFRNEEIEI